MFPRRVAGKYSLKVLLPKIVGWRRNYSINEEGNDWGSTLCEEDSKYGRAKGNDGGLHGRIHNWRDHIL